MPLFDQLNIWTDLTPRTGEENMAIDEILLTQANRTPLLRFYQWSRPSISFGYFTPLAEAQAAFPESTSPLHYIRRWTGGGIVDHRVDLTYTLVVPKSHPLSQMRGAESYAKIHHVVATALQHQGIDAQVIEKDSGNDSAACFSNPVAFDIVSNNGDKLAGAGQKRSRHGLLHQGSVVGISDTLSWQQTFSKLLATSLIDWQLQPELLKLAQQISQDKYQSPPWRNKR